MSLLRREQVVPGTPADFLSRQRKAGSSAGVTTTTALRNSAVWACLALRSNLISTMPLDVFRKSGSIDLPMVTPPLLVEPSSYGDGQPMDITDWMAATQMDLDRSGNAFGVITARDGLGLPAQIDPVPAEDARVRTVNGRIQEYKFGRSTYTPREVWHERQYVVPGLPMGLSPIAYAAWSISGYLSAQAFAIEWFAGGAVPAGDLAWTAGKLEPREAEIHKRRFMESVANGEPFVHGKDWTYTPIGSKASEAKFLEQMNYGVADVCRFLGVPGDMIDAPSAGSSVTYANITQRNLQLLIMNIGPAITRRERALSRTQASGRRVKLNTDAILRMDPAQRTTLLLARVQGKTLAPSEARALDNLPPFTPEQMDELRAMQILSDPKLQQNPGGAK